MFFLSCPTIQHIIIVLLHNTYRNGIFQRRLLLIGILYDHEFCKTENTRSAVADWDTAELVYILHP